jgi:transcriptional regulator with XRE-family HTH domain
MPAGTPQIGGIIRSARESMGLSLSELAKLSSVPKQTIGLVENNKRMPSLKVFCRLVHALDISADRVVYPHRASRALEHEQFFNGYLALDKHEQRFMQIILRALRHDASEKQS